MKFIRFLWNESKNKTNKTENHIPIEGSQAVFFDKNALLLQDPESRSERMFVIIGKNPTLNMVVVCRYKHRTKLSIEILEARKATKGEASQYYKRAEVENRAKEI